MMTNLVSILLLIIIILLILNLIFYVVMNLHGQKVWRYMKVLENIDNEREQWVDFLVGEWLDNNPDKIREGFVNKFRDEITQSLKTKGDK